MRQLQLILAAFLALLSPTLARGDAPDPEKPGPYPVGVTSIPLADESRIDSALNAPRPLMAEIWYPAADSVRGAEPTKFTDFYMNGENEQMNLILSMAFKFDIATMDERFKTIAVRDAEIAEGTFPLIIFSHGNGGMRAQSTFWCDHLASHGYIVAAVDHTRNACATPYGTGVIPFDRQGRGQAAIDRPKDVSFLIDAMAKMNGDAESRFHGRVDLDRIGAGGHSFGGFTAMGAQHHDARIKAIVPKAAVVPEYTQSSSVPLLMFIATEDATINAQGNAGARAYFERTDTPKYLVEMPDAGHYSFSDMYQINPAWGDGVGEGERITNGEPITYLGMERVHRLTNGYTTAFFGKHLKDEARYAEYLNENRDPEAMIHAVGNVAEGAE